MVVLGNLVVGIVYEVNMLLGIVFIFVSNCKEELKGIYWDFENDELIE